MLWNTYWLPREDTRFRLRFRLLRAQSRFFLNGNTIRLLLRARYARRGKAGQPNT